jgi:hypothetical protein
MKIVKRTTAIHKAGKELIIYDQESWDKFINNLMKCSDESKYVKIVTPGKIEFKKKFKVHKNEL